ncbi:MAG TPA: serine/threonine-protein kinase, partial [Chroococcales cyanobacterium]
MTLDGNRNIEKVKKCPACNRRFTGTMVVCQHDGTLLIPVKQDQLIGTLLAEKYSIIEEVGRGGMSIVYKGRHELMDRTVAVKMLQAQLVEDQTSIKRFQQEAKAASCLTHPNVITVYDFGIAPTGQPYLVMDFLEGESLIDIIKRDNHVEVSRVLNLFIQACDALEHAHQKGVLHRDLKSSNIMLIDFEGKKDVVKVVDFGIAKLMPSSGKQSQNLTQTGEIFGSPIYMSPEQCLGQPLDVRSDVYSMGTMLYESLTGDPPLMGDTVVATMQMHVASQPPSFEEMRPDLYVPPLLEAACMKALQKKPADRFQSMEEFKLALQRIQRQMANDPGQAPVSASVGKSPTPRSTVQNLTGQRAKSIPEPMISDNREVR